MAETGCSQLAEKPPAVMEAAARLNGASGKVHCEKFVEFALVPPGFTARTRKKYCVPAVSPLTS